MLVLDTHDATAPLSGQIGVVVELGLEEVAELLEIDEVFAPHLGQSDTSGRLEVDKLAKVSLAADETERDTLLAAESGQVNNELDGVDVVCNHNHLCLVVLDQRRDVVEAKLEVHGLLGLLGTIVGGLTFSLGLESIGLLLLCLRGVLGQQFKELGSCN